jgi:hypothetical protein
MWGQRLSLSRLTHWLPRGQTDRPCPCSVRVIPMDLSGAGRVARTSRLWALPSGFQGLMQPSSSSCGRTWPALPSDHPPCQPLTRPAAGATAGRGTAALHVPSRRDPSGPRPWRAFEGTTAWPIPSPWLVQAVVGANASSRGATRNCGTRGTRPVADATPLRVCTAC